MTSAPLGLLLFSLEVVWVSSTSAEIETVEGTEAETALAFLFEPF